MTFNFNQSYFYVNFYSYLMLSATHTVFLVKLKALSLV